MLTIKCAKCKEKIFKYKKYGSGEVLRCYKSRISHDQSLKAEGQLKCKCGNLIGIDLGSYYKMRKPAFVYSGTKIT